jgi:hypothetical protein
VARRGMWIGVGVVALGTALAGVMAPTMAARTLEGKLVAAMSKRELDVRWDKIEVEYGGDVLLHGVRFADELKGVELGVELVRITPALRSLLGDDPRIKRIELEGVRAQGDAIKLKRWWDGRKKSDEDKTKDKESEGGGLSKRLMAGLKASPPTIEAHDVDVALKADGASLASVHAEEGLIDADGQQLSVSGHGMLTLEHARVPDFARAPRGWKLEGSADLEHRAVKMRLGAASAEEALLEVVIPKFGAARVGRVGADISLSEQTGLSAELVVEQGKLLLGEQERPALRVEGAQIMVGMVAGRPKVRAVNASLSVNPKQINRLGEMRAALKGSLGGLADLAGSALGKKADAAKKKKKAPTRQEELEKMGAQLTKLLWAADIEIEQGDIALELGTEDEDLQRIVLVEGLSGVIQRGLVYGRGTSAGGDFQGLASFVPGEVVPQVAWVEARGVDLQKIPGLSEGRSLPSRGIRGKVGGIVDVRMIASTPEQGMHAPGLPGELRAVVEASWRDGVIDLHGLADDPVTGISGTTTMELRLSPKLGMIKLEEGHAQTGELVGSYSASMMDWPWRTVVRLDASLDEADCQSMVDALPRAMLGPYQNVQLMGRAAPTLKFVYPLYDAYKTELEVGGMSEKSPQGWTYRCGVARLNAAPEAQPVLVQGESPRPSMPTLIMTPLRDGGEAYLSNTRPTVHDDVHWLNGNFIKLVQEGVDKGVEIKVGPGVETYVPLSEMPRYVAAAMYLSEEIAFYGNRGISMGLILKALKLDLDRGRFVYGGSTVTQQLVKNMFLTRNKTLARKLQEALIAFRMDEVVSKARILELYLNCIEFGPNVYGIGPAAKYYFNKDARQLTPLESIFLAGLKPSPRYGAVLRKRGKVSLTDPHYSKRTETIFMRMVDYGIVSIEEALKARPYDIRWGAEGVYEGSSGNGMPTAPWPKPGEPLFPIASERPREGNRLEKLMDAGFVVRTPEGLVQPQAPAAPVELLP